MTHQEFLKCCPGWKPDNQQDAQFMCQVQGANFTEKQVKEAWGKTHFARLTGEIAELNAEQHEATTKNDALKKQAAELEAENAELKSQHTRQANVPSKRF